MGFSFFSKANSLKSADDHAVLEAFSRSQAIIEFKPDGTIVTANPNFLAALGYELADIAGKHHRLFVEPAFAASPDYRAFWESLGRGEYQAGTFRRLGNGGKEVWIEASYNPVLDPRVGSSKSSRSPQTSPRRPWRPAMRRGSCRPSAARRR